MLGIISVFKLDLVNFFIFFQAGLFHDIQPEPIKAQDGDTGINVTVTYSITGGK